MHTMWRSSVKAEHPKFAGRDDLRNLHLVSFEYLAECISRHFTAVPPPPGIVLRPVVLQPATFRPFF
jgi:hypothetical protein